MFSFSNIITGIIIGFFMALIFTAVEANETIVSKPILCNTNIEIVKEFYYKENLVPLIGGGSKIQIDENPKNTDNVAIIILFDGESSIAIMEYHDTYVCALAFVHDIEFDTKKLKEFLNYDDERTKGF